MKKTNEQVLESSKLRDLLKNHKKKPDPKVDEAYERGWNDGYRRAKMEGIEIKNVRIHDQEWINKKF